MVFLKKSNFLVKMKTNMFDDHNFYTYRLKFIAIFLMSKGACRNSRMRMVLV